MSDLVDSLLLLGKYKINLQGAEQSKNTSSQFVWYRTGSTKYGVFIPWYYKITTFVQSKTVMLKCLIET